MIIIKEGYGKKDKSVIECILCDTVDLMGEFYLTKDNVRIYLRDNPEILLSCLNKGDKWVYDEESLKGMGFVTGWSDKSPRKYVKLLTNDEKLADKLLKVISWNVKSELYAKLKKNNKLIKIFNKNGYQFRGDRGSEILLCKQYIARPERTISKEKDNEHEYTRRHKN
jgi:hypothetical protein